MKIKNVFLSFVCLSLLACNGSGGQSNGDLSVTDLQGNAWLLNSYGTVDFDQFDLIENTSYSLSFNETGNTLEGTFSCNGFESEYLFVNNQLTIEPFSVPEVGCFDDADNFGLITAQDDFVRSVILTTVNVEIVGDTLTLFSDDDRFLMYEAYEEEEGNL